MELVDFGNWNYILYSSTELEWRTENDMCICLTSGIYVINRTANMLHRTMEFSIQLVRLCFLNLLFVSRRTVCIISIWFHSVPTVLEFMANLGPSWGLLAGTRIDLNVCHIQHRPRLASLYKWKLVSRGTYNVWSRSLFRGSSRAPRVYTHGKKHHNPFPSIRDTFHQFIVSNLSTRSLEFYLWAACLVVVGA